MFPTANWHERETFDFYGIVFDGHPDLTRILLPDDWEGHPLRKDEALGGVNTRYHGAFIPPVDTAHDHLTDAGTSPTDARSLPRTPSGEIRQETMIINMGPQHPSTHGVLRLLLELDGETVITCKPIIGYLHTGIEKNTEYRTWVQGITYVTRADYLSPFFNELGYCLAVERLLGIEAPPRAQVIRVLFYELNRISSHLVWLATGGLELGAVSVMLYGFREREVVLDIFEAVTGPADEPRVHPHRRRDHGRATRRASSKIRAFLDEMPKRIDDYETTPEREPDLARAEHGGRACCRPTDALALGVTGPMLRAAGVAADLRKDAPYCGYETYDFDVPVRTEADAYARYVIRLAEMRESMKIVAQCLDRLEEPGPGDGRGPEGRRGPRS